MPKAGHKGSALGKKLLDVTVIKEGWCEVVSV